MSNASEARELRKEQQQNKRKERVGRVTNTIASIILGAAMLWLGWRFADTTKLLAPNQDRLYTFYAEYVEGANGGRTVTLARRSVSAYWKNPEGGAAVRVNGVYFVIGEYEDFDAWMKGRWGDRLKRIAKKIGVY